MDNADTPTTRLKKSILRIASAMNSRTSQPFILVGGASLMLYGSNRITTDIDFLVPNDKLNEFMTAKDAILEQRDEYIASIDLLRALYDRFEPINIQSIQPYVATLQGVRVPQLDVLLGTKIISHHGRAEGEAGDRKRQSDTSDIHWISKKMQKQRLRVRREVCDLFVGGPYNMLLVLEAVYDEFGKEGVALFDLVGGRE